MTKQLNQGATTVFRKKFLRGATAIVMSALFLLLPLRFAAAEAEDAPDAILIVVAEVTVVPEQTETAETAEPTDSGEALPEETSAQDETEAIPASTPAPEETPLVSAELSGEAPVADEQPPIRIENEYVFYASDESLAASLCSQYGGTLLRYSDGLGVMYCESFSCDSANIFFPQEVYLVSSAPYFAQEGESATNIASAQGLATNDGAGVLIAVIDSGIDLDHPALVDSILDAVSVIPDSAYGDSGYFYEDYLGAQDNQGHGSHVSGTIVGQTDEMTLGIAPQAQILSIKALEKYGSSAAGTTEWLIRAILLAIARDVDIINLSVGGSKNYVSAAQAAFAQAADAGILVICATGNSQTGPTAGIDYPAAYDNTLAVTSVTIDGSDITLSNFSRYGEGTDLSAPGVAIYSCDADGSYQTLSGTSMSCGIVTGIAALLLSENPDLSPSDLIRLLERSATDAGAAGYDTRFGWGVVNAEEALLLLRHGRETNEAEQTPVTEEPPVSAPEQPIGQEVDASEDWLTTQQDGAQTQQTAQNMPTSHESQWTLYVVLLLSGVALACVYLLIMRKKRASASAAESD